MSNLDLAIGTFAAVAVILAATAAAGRVATRIGQSRVVGEMVAGVLLGPTLLGAVAPGAQAALFPENVRSVLYVLSTLGLTLYMFLVGVDVDISAVNGAAARRSVGLALSGIVPSFVLGALLAYAFYDRLAVPGSGRLLFAIFLGAALSITAFPMLARILDEEGLAGSRIGSLTLVAAAVDDAFAWVMLAVVAAMATSGAPQDVLVTLAGAVTFTVVMLTVVRRLLVPLGRRAAARGHLTQEDIAVIMLLVLAAGWFTDEIGIFSVFGGFVAGLAMPRDETVRREVRARLSDLTVVVLLPIFFAYSGLSTDVAGAGGLGLVLPATLLLAASFIGKYAGCGATVRAMGFSWREASAIGGLMNARGLMILVYITIGSAHGIISPQLFTLLVLVAVVTTAAAAPIYRRSMPSRPAVPASRVSGSASA